jgi:hypothetical protein
MSPDQRYAVAVTCIDGRIHDALRRWMHDHLEVDIVDLVILQGSDAVVATCNDEWAQRLTERVRVSHGARSDTRVVLASHSGCVANPVTDAEHRRNLGKAAARMRSFLPEMEIVAVHLEQRGGDWKTVPVDPAGHEPVPG